MTGNSGKDQIFIRKLTEIVLANLEDESFGIKELAEKTGISHYSLRRRLHSIAGKNISQFIRETRLDKAMDILKNENVTVSEVAYKVGFSSPAYFNTCFHEFFGFSPGSVKKGENNISEEVKQVPDSGKRVGKRYAGRIIIQTLSVIIISSGLFFIVYSLFFETTDYEGKSVEESGKSIAVLPFNNLSDSTANQYFIDGVMDEILADLSRIHNLRVVSRTSVEQFRKSKISTSEIARKLKVNYLVEGSGQKYGNRFRLRVQLIETSKDRHIWARSYEQEISETSDIFNIQSEVAQSVASELNAKITPEEKRIIEKIPTTNLTAYDFYQRGNDEFSKYPFPNFNKESIEKAENLFKNALKCDSTFALAYVGLAYVIWKRWDNDNSVLENGELNNYMDSMLVLANKALSIDDQLDAAYRVRGEYYSVKGTVKQALEEWNKALKYNPNDGTPYTMMGGLYEELDIVKSLEYMHRAALMNHGRELTQNLTSLGINFYKAGFPEKGNYFLLEALKMEEDSIKYTDNIINSRARTTGEYKKAADHFERRYRADSTNEEALLRLGYYNSLTGHDSESLKYYKKYLSAINSFNETNSRFTRYTRLGYAYLKNGFRKEAEYYFNKQIEICYHRLESVRPGEKIYWLYPLATIYMCLGEKDKAYENLKIFNQAQSFNLEWVTLLKTDPIFNSIRNEPEFQHIVNDVEAKYLAEHERVKRWLEEQMQL